MSDKSSLAEIQAAITAAEHALGRFGSDLQFLVTRDGRIEIARRTPTGETVMPKEVVAELHGSDLALWRAESPAVSSFRATKMMDEIRSFSKRLSPEPMVLGSEKSNGAEKTA